MEVGNPRKGDVVFLHEITHPRIISSLEVTIVNQLENTFLKISKAYKEKKIFGPFLHSRNCKMSLFIFHLFTVVNSYLFSEISRDLQCVRNCLIHFIHLCCK